MKILMVCLGNICRSPLAEGIMRHKLMNNQIDASVESCGFESFHVGDKADRRAAQVAAENGVDLSGHRARTFKVSFFDEFDRIYVMDNKNFSDVASKARNSEDLKKVDYIMNMVYPGTNMAVPDPYYGGQDGFRKTWNMLDAATEKIVDEIKGLKK
ncbi:MAG: low molecular weight phosphotyrosine protein phosphatase [Bacteroidales bacterium]|nr:low molecular weight phosphotyrosine protein phosphatase [Bacteroidales bacterium]